MKFVSFTRGRYSVSVTVPRELREIVGKRELVEPLGGDKKVAERRAVAQTKVVVAVAVSNVDSVTGHLLQT